MGIKLPKLSLLLGSSLLLSAVYFAFPGTLPLIPRDNTEVSSADRNRIIELDYDGFMKLYEQGGIFLADARSQDQFQKGHIPGAVNIPYGESYAWLDTLEAMDRPSMLVAYCGGGACQASRELVSSLYFLFDSSAVFNGGWHEWRYNHE